MADAPEIVGREALGPAFQDLFRVIEDTATKTVRFKSVFKRLSQTTRSILPVFNDVDKLDGVLNRPEEETEMFIRRLIIGRCQVEKCSSIAFWNLYKKHVYSAKLHKLDADLLRFFRVSDPAQLTISSMKIEVKINDLRSKLDQVVIGGSGNRVPIGKKGLERLEIPLDEIKSATGNFSEANLIGEGGFGKVYKGKLSHHRGNTIVAVKRFDPDSKQGEHEFMTEISMLSNCQHPNLISLIGYCKDDSEMILIYEYAQNGSLDKVLWGQNRSRCLKWEERLNIAIGAASGLNYLHTDVGTKYRVIHRDVKSSNILLCDNWVAKISDFGLSKVGPADQPCTFLMSKPAGTFGYFDPEYMEKGVLTKESDVYSFGVVLFEILSGSPALIQGKNGEVQTLVQLVHRCFEEENLDDVVDPYIREQITLESLKIYTTIAYQCLSKERIERPTMVLVLKQLQHALNRQIREPGAKMLKGMYNLEIPLEEIKSATGNFGGANLIGEGGFGKVYKGKLSHHSGNTVVAVKRLDSKSMQGQHEFMTEISMLSNCRHPNLISLIGYYKDDSELILVYEYAQYGSLDKVLWEQKRIGCLTWEDRLNIAIGAASGLKYLHTDVGPMHRIIHRDVTSSNILLCENWEAKISGFGLSMIGPANQLYSCIKSKVAGTPGYCDPEYIETGVLRKESDVYSFGVVLFKILSGRPVLNQEKNDELQNLVPLFRHCFVAENLDIVVDPNIREQIASESLKIYTTIAYQCLSNNHMERPTMALIVQQLQHALRYQTYHHKIKEPRAKMLKSLESLEIPLEEIKSATGNFNEANLIGEGGFGKVYKGKLSHHRGNTVVAAKRLDSRSEQGEHEFMTEITMLSNCQHPNLICLIGYCKDDSELILVYEYAQHGSLDKVLWGQKRIRCLRWEDRLKIGIGAASGLNYLHTEVGPMHRIIHCNVNSSNILLGDNQEAKISDLGLSKVGPANQACSFIMSPVAGTPGYCDPEYIETGVLRKESDVYSFGVVLFEILSGKPALIVGENGELQTLVQLVRRCFEEENFDDVVDPCIREQIASESLKIYITIAYQCLSNNHMGRPMMALVVQQLEHALNYQSQLAT